MGRNGRTVKHLKSGKHGCGMLNPARPVSPQVRSFRDSISPCSDVATVTVVTQGRDPANKLNKRDGIEESLQSGNGEHDLTSPG